VKFWNNILSKKVLVTGGCGFIGSHLVEFLSKENYEVSVFDKYNIQDSYGWLDGYKYKSEIDFYMADIRDFDAVSKAVKGKDIVIHCAALIGIPYSYYSPLAYINTNITGTYNILEAVKSYNTSQAIITSTSEVYGTALYTPIDESHPIQPQSPYSASKASADTLAISYYKSFKTPVKIIRPFNTFGPRQSMRAVIPTIINQVLDKKIKKIELGDITTKRDFTYVDDTCLAYEHLIKLNKFGEVYNLGTSKSFSIKDIAEKVFEITNIRKNITLNQNRLRPKNSEVRNLLSNNEKFKKSTSWINIKNLNQGLKKTINWYKKNTNNNQYSSKYVI
tara:strand:- start:841 stop:1842 length:1002 start_codon:yes stop_codon:yes gene_type:complete